MSERPTFTKAADIIYYSENVRIHNLDALLNDMWRRGYRYQGGPAMNSSVIRAVFIRKDWA